MFFFPLQLPSNAAKYLPTHRQNYCSFHFCHENMWKLEFNSLFFSGLFSRRKEEDFRQDTITPSLLRAETVHRTKIRPLVFMLRVEFLSSTVLLCQPVYITHSLGSSNIGLILRSQLGTPSMSNCLHKALTVGR